MGWGWSHTAEEKNSREKFQFSCPGQEGFAATTKCWAKAETSNSQRVQWDFFFFFCLIKSWSRSPGISVSARLWAGAWEQSAPLDGGFSWREFKFIPLERGLVFSFYGGGKEKPQISLGFNLLSWREKLLKDFGLEKRLHTWERNFRNYCSL